MALYEFADAHGLITVQAPMKEGPGAPPLCTYCGKPLQRIYSVVLGNGLQLQRERERGGASAVRDLFLPTAKDFAGPNDPDGSKGIQSWAEEHSPQTGNKKPLYPDIPKKVF
jgi:hypothetical protein